MTIPDIVFDYCMGRRWSIYDGFHGADSTDANSCTRSNIPLNDMNNPEENTTRQLENNGRIPLTFNLRWGGQLLYNMAERQGKLGSTRRQESAKWNQISALLQSRMNDQRKQENEPFHPSSGHAAW